jgi:magnesium-protoporphyrin IX monomethyl ester (oxidative) cyclase
MRVCLVTVPWTTVRGYEDSLRVPFPVGLGYIAGFLREQGVEVGVVDALALGWRNRYDVGEGFLGFGLRPDEVAERVAAFSPDVVCISCMFTSQSGNLYQTAQAVKERLPEVFVVAGGAHCSALPQETLACEAIDVVVVGEGEHTIFELCEFVAGRKNIDDIKGVYYKSAEGVKFTGLREPLVNLDELPMPAYELFPMSEYFESAKFGFAPRSAVDKRWMSVVTSRGCPFRCTFCSVHLVSGRRWRARSVGGVVEEIEYLHREFGVEHIFFEDDNLTFDVKRAEELFREIIARNIDITWETPNGIRADRLTGELVGVMKKSGCVGLTVAVECGDQEFLQKVIRKNLDLNRLLEGVRLIRREEIDLSAFFILGMPGETERTFQNTMRFARQLARLGVRPFVNIAVPLPGTDMYEEAKARGFLVGELEPVDYLLGMQKPLLETGDFDAELLLKWRRKMIILCAVEMLLHSPSSIFASSTFERLRRNPLSLLRNLRILSRGTC